MLINGMKPETIKRRKAQRRLDTYLRRVSLVDRLQEKVNEQDDLQDMWAEMLADAKEKLANTPVPTEEFEGKV